MSNVPTLYDYQRPHFNKLLSSHKLYRVGVDTSTTGSGKTIVSIKLAQRLNLPIFIVCPKTLIGKWRTECDMNMYKPIDIVSSDNFKLESCKYTKITYASERSSEIKNVEMTADMPRTPIMLVIDECHLGKNSSRRSIAMAAVAHHVRMHGGCVHIMSATMADRDNHANYIFNLLGVSTTRNGSHYSVAGLRDIRDFIEQVAARNGLEVPRTNDPKTLFITGATVIRSNMYFKSAQQDAKNMFFNVDEDDALRINQELTSALSLLQSEPGFFQITRHLRNIELLKCGVFERATRRTLERNKNVKVLIFLNFKDSITKLAQLLSAYNPLVLNGDVESKKRDDVVNRFNRPDLSYRVLIANPEVGGTGYDLDDKDGDFPRVSFISPSYKTTIMVQTIGRTCRATTKSLSVIRMLYVTNCKTELSLLDAMAQKTETIREFSNNHHIIYPSQYKSVDEDENPYTPSAIISRIEYEPVQGLAPIVDISDL